MGSHPGRQKLYAEQETEYKQLWKSARRRPSSAYRCAFQVRALRLTAVRNAQAVETRLNAKITDPGAPLEQTAQLLDE